LKGIEILRFAQDDRRIRIAGFSDQEEHAGPKELDARYRIPVSFVSGNRCPN
jgi:hypothetical protein